MKKVHGLRIVEGMEEEKAREYVTFRKEIDQEVLQIMNLGEVINGLSQSDVEMVNVAALGIIIRDKGQKILERLDDFVSDVRVQCDLRQAGFVG